MRPASVGGWVLLSVLLLTACSRESSQPRNVVLISLDTLRVDRMSLYGGKRPTTPTIDALAAKGIRFTNAFSPSPWTLPAHAAMLTGRYPSSLSSNLDDHLYKLAPLLSTLVKKHGYQTAAVTGGAFVSKAYGADAGFDSFRVGQVADAEQWIRSSAKEPFFFFFHTYAAHIPYADRRFAHGLDGGQLGAIYTGKPKDWVGQHLLVTCGWITLSPAEKEFLLSLYDGGVAAADEMVAHILAALERAQLLQRTIVVITSDHGEEFWDHSNRAAYHGHSLYNELLRVPLVWYEPGLRPLGSTRTEPVSLIDIVPTVMARLGFAVPPGVDGLNLSPLLEGDGWGVDRKLFGEAVRHGPPRQSVTAAGGKLIVTLQPDVQLGEGQRCPVSVPEPRELYLSADPGERQNRIHDLAPLAAVLDRELQSHGQPSPGAPAASGRTPLDDATQERLRGLGYLE